MNDTHGSFFSYKTVKVMHEVFLLTDYKYYNVRFRLRSIECNIFISVLRWASSDRHFISSLCVYGASACWWCRREWGMMAYQFQLVLEI